MDIPPDTKSMLIGVQGSRVRASSAPRFADSDTLGDVENNDPGLIAPIAAVG
jgi:hypothetical protein